MSDNRFAWAALLGCALHTSIATAQGRPSAPDRPEIIRTEHGVPHIFATGYWGAGYGLAWVELEDYGARVVNTLVEGRGERGLVFGRDSMEADFTNRPVHARAVAKWPELDVATRAMYDGFAAAVNDFVKSHPSEVTPTIRPVFAGWDVLAAEIPSGNVRGAKRLAERLAPPPAAGKASDEGSNAWAIAPRRTKSGHAILLRNPHLAWDAGYYEAHVVIPGELDFYGDFRIGGAFAVVGGFNRNLGWATTNNAVDPDEVYSIPLARGRSDRIVLDARPVPLTKSVVTVPFITPAGRATETREFWSSPFGPVVERRNGRAYILKSAGAGEFRGGQQFLRMMRAGSFAEWEAAMKMRARLTSNLTYADRAGNIFYVWNGALPSLPHPPGGDSTVIPVTHRREMWDHLVPWDSMPRILNPPGGYLQNENDSPHFASLEAPLDPARLPPNVEPPSLGLRGQLALDLIRYQEDTLSLEDVVRIKHSYRMLLAERMLPNLIELAEGQQPVREAVSVLKAWDQSVAPTSRGGVLFEMWWRLYQARTKQPFATPWSFAEPTATPRGIASPTDALAALSLAADSVRRRFGRLDAAWGEVHRIRIGAKDLPVGGCRGDLGCFRVLWFRDDQDGRRAVQGGDGWILAVEFGDQPKAYSVLAYGESNRPASPFFGDQADRFAAGDLKPVAYSRNDIERQAIRRYRAGCATDRCLPAAPADSLLRLETLLAPATNVAPQISPDGRWISFLRPVEGAMNLFVARSRAINSAKPVTHRRGRGLQPFDVSGNVLYRWTPDSKRIVFPEDNNGDEKWNLHVVDVATGAERNLTPLPGVEVSFLSFSERDPNTAAVAIKQRSPSFPDLYRLDLTTGERTLILQNDAMVAVMPDRLLRPRVGIAVAADGTLDLYRPKAGGGWDLLWDIGPEDVAGLNATSYQRAWGFDRDNRNLFLYDTEGRDLTALVALDVETGKRTVLAHDAVSDLAGVLYHPTHYALQAYATMWTRTAWHAVDPTVKRDLDRLAKVADGDFRILSRSNDLESWIVEYSLSDAPKAYYLYHHLTGAATKLFVDTPSLVGVKFSRFHPFEIKSADGLPLVSYYLLPPWSDRDGDGKPDVPQPTVVLVHGGPSDERAQWGFGPFVHWLANRGYAVLYLNYRGSAGFGKKYLNGQNLEWGGKMHTDILEQVDWAVRQGITAPGRVAILGGSYGGYEVLVGMTMTPERFACGVDLVGPSNLEKFMPHWNVDRMSQVVGDPRTEAGRALLRSRSPINFAGNTQHPVLIGQGSNDARVPKYQSDTVVAAMKKAGVSVIYLVYPDEGHGLLRPANSHSFWTIGEQFLAKCLGGRAAPLGSLAGSSVIIETGAEYIPGLAEAQRKH